MPRKIIPSQRRAIRVPISMYPCQITLGRRLARASNISFSRYLQALHEYNARHNILTEAINLFHSPKT